MQVAVNIIEDYIILGGTEFLSMHASSVAKILDLIVGNVNDKGLLSTLPVIDILVQVTKVDNVNVRCIALLYFLVLGDWSCISVVSIVSILQKSFCKFNW